MVYQGDVMGASAAVGDLDGDGYGEVVVGLPGEDVGTAKDAGGVLVFKGRASGITGAETKVIGQSTAKMSGVDEQSDEFGGEVHVVAPAKGVRATLALAAPGENTGRAASGSSRAAARAWSRRAASPSASRAWV